MFEKLIHVLFLSIIQVNGIVSYMSESFGISRTLRKTAEARATRAGISAKLQDKMNRWKTVEAADGRKPRFQMSDLYAGVLAQMPTTWRYSYAL